MKNPKIIIENLVAFTQDNKQGTINLAFKGLEGYKITGTSIKDHQVFITVEKEKHGK
jgi:hypothetical protein